MPQFECDGGQLDPCYAVQLTSSLRNAPLGKTRASPIEGTPRSVTLTHLQLPAVRLE